MEQIKQDACSGLERIDKTLLPGRLKLWCFQFGLLLWLLWPLTIYEMPLAKVEKLDRLISSFVKKCLSLLRCRSSIWPYGKCILELLVFSLVEEYKCSKVRLEMMLL